MPYTNEEGIKIIRQAYAKVDFDGEFLQGDSENYDENSIYFSELLNNDLPFLNKETGKETYLEDFDRLAIYEDLEYSQILVQCALMKTCSVNIARCKSLIRAIICKMISSPANCDTHLAESDFRTRPNAPSD